MSVTHLLLKQRFMEKYYGAAQLVWGLLGEQCLLHVMHTVCHTRIVEDTDSLDSFNFRDCPG